MGIGNLYKKIYLEPIFNPKLYRGAPLDEPRFGKVKPQFLTGDGHFYMYVYNPPWVANTCKLLIIYNLGYRPDFLFTPPPTPPLIALAGIPSPTN